MEIKMLSLPYELIFEIAFFLDLKSIPNFLGVCKEVHSTVDEERFWKLYLEENQTLSFYRNIIEGKCNKEIIDTLSYTATIMFDFDAEDEEELGAKEGEVVSIVSFENEWLRIKNKEGKTGFIPTSYVFFEKGSNGKDVNDLKEIKKNYDKILKDGYKQTISFLFRLRKNPLFNSDSFLLAKSKYFSNKRIRNIKKGKNFMDISRLSQKTINHITMFLSATSLLNCTLLNKSFAKEDGLMKKKLKERRKEFFEKKNNQLNTVTTLQKEKQIKLINTSPIKITKKKKKSCAIQ